MLLNFLAPALDQLANVSDPDHRMGINAGTGAELNSTCIRAWVGAPSGIELNLRRCMELVLQQDYNSNLPSRHDAGCSGDLKQANGKRSCGGGDPGGTTGGFVTES